MEFKYHNIDISMRPGDKIRIDVGLFHRCDITVTSDGKLQIYHENGNLEI